MKTDEVKRILIVEDETDIIFSIRFALNRKGYLCDYAVNGKEGLEKILENISNNTPFDLLITDIQMPDMTGTEMIEKIRAEDIDIPILVMTGYGSKEMVVDLMRLGCHDYLDKPFKVEQLMEHVRSVIEKHQAQVEARDKKIIQMEKDVRDYESELAYYQQSLAKYEERFKDARGAYESLIQLNPEDCTGFPLSWKVRQLAELGGDYLDIRRTNLGWDILLADVSGHDMGASYHTVLLKAFFEENIRTGLDGITFFDLINHQLLQSKNAGRMVTAAFLRINRETMTGEVVSAGHPSMIRIRDKLENPFVFELEGDVLGMHTHIQAARRQFELKSGDRYILYSDGILDTSCKDGETGKKCKLGLKGLLNLIQKYKNLPLSQMVDAIWKAILMICHYKPKDDMLLVAFEIPANGE